MTSNKRAFVISSVNGYFAHEGVDSSRMKLDKLKVFKSDVLQGINEAKCLSTTEVQREQLLVFHTVTM